MGCDGMGCDGMGWDGVRVWEGCGKGVVTCGNLW